MPDDATDRTQGEDALEAAQGRAARLLSEGRGEEALAVVDALHPADQAELISWLDEELRALLMPHVSQEALAGMLDYFQPEPRSEIVAELDPSFLAPVLDQVDPDVAVDVLHGLPPERAHSVLEAMTRSIELLPLLPHADETAGGRMTIDFVALHGEWSVDDALSYLRRTRPSAEQVYYLYVVDEEHRLEGVVSLRHLVVAEPPERIDALMTSDVVSVTTEEDQEDVARRIQRYNLIALPVIDDERRLVGVVSVDDLIDVLEEEATEDMYRMAGLVEGETLERPILRSIAPRLSWLLLNLAMVFAAAGVVNSFKGTIARVAVLAVFMPVIAGLAGNAGVQTITLVVRSLALGRVELRDVWPILRREALIGLTNGVVIGLVLGTLVFAWQGNVALAIVAGVAMLLSMATAVIAGVLVPLTLRALRLDPALASGVLVTTVTDVVGLFFFLGLATLLVDQIA